MMNRFERYYQRSVDLAHVEGNKEDRKLDFIEIRQSLERIYSLHCIENKLTSR